MQRALEQVASALVAGGHRVVELPAEKLKTLHRRGTACVMKSNVQNGGRGVMKHIQASGEPVVPRTATGSSDSLLTTEEVFANHMERGQIAYEYATLWQEYGMDAILAPAVAHPAPPHGKYISNSYATIYNMLDYTTGSIPVTTVSRDDSPEREWLDQAPYPRIEPVRFPYDLGDKEMKELCKSTSHDPSNDTLSNRA
jgi:amidase